MQAGVWKPSPWPTLAWVALLLAVVGMTGSAAAQTENGITSPARGDVVSGIVIIRGTATDSGFLRYEVAFRSGNDWIVMADGDAPVINGALAIWDTTVGGDQGRIFPDGVYELRLRVVRQDYNYDEYFVGNLIVANENAVATETPTPALEDDADPDQTRTPIPTIAPGEDVVLPAILPSLTPFPTPSPQATPVNLPATGGEAGDADSAQNAGASSPNLSRIFSVGQFNEAFWQGARIAFVLFAAWGVYLLLRGVWRWLWRWFRGQRSF